MQLPCPRCRRGLHEEDGVDRCAHCGGVWFDRGELEHVVATSAPPEVPPVPAPEPEVRYLPCPRCHTLMARVAYRRVSGVVLDTCNAHGTWADGGELERILAFEAGSGPERLERREVDEARLQRERDIEARARWERVRSALRAW